MLIYSIGCHYVKFHENMHRNWRENKDEGTENRIKPFVLITKCTQIIINRTLMFSFGSVYIYMLSELWLTTVFVQHIYYNYYINKFIGMCICIR